MRHKPRGRAVILNIINYDRDAKVDDGGRKRKAKDRHGADVDQANMENLLTDLHFTVEVWKNVEDKKVLYTTNISLNGQGECIFMH